MGKIVALLPFIIGFTTAYLFSVSSVHAENLFYDSFNKSSIDLNKWDTIDPEDRLDLVTERGTLRVDGGGTWNDPALYTKSTYERIGGRAFVNLFRGNVSLPVTTYHFATEQNPTDPSIDGYGIYSDTNYRIYSVTPGSRIYYPIIAGAGSLYSIDFAGLSILRPNSGSYHLVSGGNFGTYPTATLIWVNQTGTDSDLYGGINFNDGNSSVRSSKIVDLDGNFATQYGLATAADTFARSDSSSLGLTEIADKAWIEVNGNWEIVNNKLQNTAGSVGTAIIDTGSAQGIYEYDFTTPSSGNEDVGIILRYSDYNNYLVAYIDSALPALRLYKKEGGSVSEIAGTGISYSNDTSYRFRVIDHDNKVCMYLNNTLPLNSCSTTSFNSGQTKAGIQVVGDNTMFDNIAFWPKTVTLPSSTIGDFLTIPSSASTTLAQDTFTNSNGTRLSEHTMNTGNGWEEVNGTWTVEENVASASARNALALTDVNEADVSVEADLTLPQAFSGTTEWMSGVILRYQDSDNYIYARFLWQSGSPEIEILEKINGTGPVLQAVQLSSLVTQNSTHNLKLVAIGNQVAAYLDDELVEQVTVTSRSGTKVGMIIDGDGSITHPVVTFDNFLVKTVEPDAIAPPEIDDLSSSGSTPSLSWTDVYDDAAGTSYYRVYRSTTSGLLGSQINTNGQTTTAAYTDNSLSNSGTYYYTVRAVDAAGNESESDNNSQISAAFIGGSPESNNNDFSTSSTSPANPNWWPLWKYPIMVGPNYIGQNSFISGKGEDSDSKAYIPRQATSIDLFVTIEHKTPQALLETFKINPFPWVQRFNTAGEIYEFSALSSFNGYPVHTFHSPVTIILPYNPKRLGKISPSQIKILKYDTSRKQWIPLTSPLVINTVNHTVATTTKDFSHFVVGYYK